MGTHPRALLALALLVLVLAALVSATYDGLEPPGADRGASETGGRSDEGGEPAPSDESPGGARPPAPPLPEAEGSPWVLPLLLLLVAVAIGILVVVVLVAAGLRLTRRSRRLTGRLAPRPGVTAAPEEEPEDEPGDLAAAVRGGLDAVEEGPPRNAVVAAWVRLEAAAISDRLPRHPSDTPSEFVERVLSAYGLDEAAIRRLADLYVEARFSRHRLTEAHRNEARHCLERLLAGLLEVRR
jgi:hypothetical protein